MRKTILISLTVILLSLCLFGDEDLRIMTYNVKDFWLKFDGEPGVVTQGGGILDDKDLEKLNIISSLIITKQPDVIAIQECASLVELIYFNKEFLNSDYLCWSFRYRDDRSAGIPLGLMVKKGLQVHSVELYKPQDFSVRGIIIAEISKSDYDFTLISVHLKSRFGDSQGDTAVKRHNQAVKLREKLKEILEEDQDANIIICGDFNDPPGRDLEVHVNLPDLLEEIGEKIVLSNNQEVEIHNATLEHEDKDENDVLWSEKSASYPAVLFDYFFLTQGAYDEFKSIDHIYPEEFVNIKKASDHIPIILELEID